MCYIRQLSLSIVVKNTGPEGEKNLNLLIYPRRTINLTRVLRRLNEIVHKTNITQSMACSSIQKMLAIINHKNKNSPSLTGTAELLNQSCAKLTLCHGKESYYAKVRLSQTPVHEYTPNLNSLPVSFILL